MSGTENVTEMQIFGVNWHKYGLKIDIRILEVSDGSFFAMQGHDGELHRNRDLGRSAEIL
jgi:hypothetical protein